MMLINNRRYKLMKITYQICFLLGLSLTAVAFDILPRYQQGSLTFENQVLAQNPSDADLTKYARAALAIEDLRKNTYSNIQGMLDKSESPQLACHQRQNFEQLPSDARSMAIDYCKQSEMIVKNNGLSIRKFNTITKQLKQNPSLYERLQKIMSQL